MSNWTVEIENLEEVQAKVTRELVTEPAKTGLEEAAHIAQRAAELAIDGGTGVAIRSINRDVTDTNARVYTAIAEARAKSIDQGRPAGADPRSILGQVINWKEAVGAADSGIEIARAISASGAEGKGFKQAAREAVGEEFDVVVSAMSAELVRIVG